MNKHYLLIALALIFSIMACEDDSPLFDNNEFTYAGVNANAPLLAQGNFEALAKFNSSDISGFTGRRIEAVEFRLYELPSKLEIVIYDGGGFEPENVLYLSDVTAQASSNITNTAFLDTPVEITGESIWVGLRMEHAQSMQSIGCDAGPANNDGDYIFDQNVGWTTFREYSGESINWNISALLD